MAYGSSSGGRPRPRGYGRSTGYAKSSRARARRIVAVRSDGNVAAEVRKLESDVAALEKAESPPKKVKVCGVAPGTSEGAEQAFAVFRRGPDADKHYIRIPVTDLMTLEQPVGAPADTNWRSPEKMALPGFELVMRVHASQQLEVFAIMFRRKHGVGGGPIPVTGGQVRNVFPTALMNIQQVDLIKADGPFRVYNTSGRLISADQSLFKAELSKGDARPLQRAIIQASAPGDEGDRKPKLCRATCSIIPKSAERFGGKAGVYEPSECWNVQIYSDLKGIELRTILGEPLEVLVGIRHPSVDMDVSQRPTQVAHMSMISATLYWD